MHIAPHAADCGATPAPYVRWLDTLTKRDVPIAAGYRALLAHNDLEPKMRELLRKRVAGEVVAACRKCFASLFTDRAVSYREQKGFGGKVISDELGMLMKNVKLDDLGQCQRVVVTKESTTFVGAQGDKSAINGRCNELRSRIKETKSDYDREKMEERLARLAGGVAVVRVGAPSESEMMARRDAFDDGISSTKAAVAEGIVPGGGLALLRAVDAVEVKAGQADGNERTGLKILRRALEAPARQIAENSNADDGVVVGKMRKGTGNFGIYAHAVSSQDTTSAWVGMRPELTTFSPITSAGVERKS